jgi:hypothetical protein
MTIMTVIVIGVKGRDYITEVKQDNKMVFDYFLRGVDTSGEFVMGWAFVIAVASSLVNYASFVFYLLEYKSLTKQSLSWSEPV